MAEFESLKPSQLGPHSLAFVAWELPLDSTTAPSVLYYAAESRDPTLASRVFSFMIQNQGLSQALHSWRSRFRENGQVNWVEFLNLFDREDSRAYFKEIFRNNRNRIELAQLIDWAIASDELLSAQTALSRYNRIVPDDVSMLEKEARVLFWRGLTKKARLVLQKALDNGSRDARLHYEYGIQLLAEGSRQEAVEHFQVVTEELSPQNDLERSMLAWSLAQTGRRREGYAMYQNLIGEQNPNLETMNDYHSLLISLGEETLLAQEAKKLNWSEISHMGLMETWFYRNRSLGKDSIALKILNRAIRVLGSRPHPYWVEVGKGWEYERRGNFKKAMAAYDRALKIQQDRFLLADRVRVRPKTQNRLELETRTRNGVDSHTLTVSTISSNSRYRVGARIRLDARRSRPTLVLRDQRERFLSLEIGKDLGLISYRTRARGPYELDFQLGIERKPYWEYSAAVAEEMDREAASLVARWQKVAYGRRFYFQANLQRRRYTGSAGNVARIDHQSLSVGRTLRRTGYLSLSFENNDLMSSRPGQTQVNFSDYRAFSLSAEWTYNWKHFSIVPRLQLLHDMQELSYGGGLELRHKNGLTLYWDTAWDRFARDYISQWGARYQREF